MGFCPVTVRIRNINKGMLSGWDFVRGDYVWRGFCTRGFCPNTVRIRNINKGILFGGGFVLDST